MQVWLLSRQQAAAAAAADAGALDAAKLPR